MSYMNQKYEILTLGLITIYKNKKLIFIIYKDVI